MGGRPQGSPLRRGYKECDAGRNPPVTASPCQSPLGKGAKGTGDADCHSQCAHWPRNDRVFTRGAVCGGTHGSRPTAEHFVGQGPCALPGVRRKTGRGNRRSAASGGCSEAISRKCPDWRPRQWPGIGWYNGGQENPAPTEGLQGMRCGEESPSHGFAVPAPFRQGGQGDGGCGLPRARCALAMTVFLQGTGARPGGSSGRPTPTTPFTDRTS